MSLRACWGRMKNSEIVTGKSAFGLVNVNEIVLSSTTLTPEISVALPAWTSAAPTTGYSGVPYWQGAIESLGLRHSSADHLTSLAVNFSPSCPVMPRRGGKVHLRVSELP